MGLYSNITSEKVSIKGGASDEEDKQMLAAFYNLGFTVDSITHIYKSNLLNAKIGENTVKESINLLKC